MVSIMFDDRLTIETPEHIDLDYEVAGLGSRAIAALIDHIIIGLVLALGTIILTAVTDELFGGLDSDVGAALFGIVLYLMMCVYYTFFETIWNGQTPGKRLVGLRVVRVGGRPIGFGGSAIRNIIRLADFLPLLYGVGIMTMFFDRQTRRLGDMAAGAVTIKETRALTLESLTAAVAQEVGGPLAENLTIPNLEVITLEDYRLLQSYLTQRLTLSLDTRRRLAGQLLHGLQTRLGYPVYGDPEAFMLRLVAEYNKLHRPAAPAPLFAEAAPSSPPLVR